MVEGWEGEGWCECARVGGRVGRSVGGEGWWEGKKTVKWLPLTSLSNHALTPEASSWLRTLMRSAKKSTLMRWANLKQQWGVHSAY